MLYRSPESIEAESLNLIRSEVGTHGFTADEFAIVERMVQAAGDLEFARTTEFQQGAVQAGIEALRQGRSLVVDVEMVVSGLRQDLLASLGVSVRCAIRDDDVRRRARELGTTRAAIAIEKVALAAPDAIVAIGNAPTALLSVAELIREHRIRPPLVIGMPVGFVLATESKELLRELNVPAILCRGRKGGSAVTVAVVNALLKITSPPAIQSDAQRTTNRSARD
ncbi:MAG: precorrin-8X methylmutase [Nitrospiraceae bacterium]